MIVCGIDPGLNRTGYGVIRADGERAEVIEAGIIRTSDQESLPDRLAALERDLSELLAEHQPDVVGVEDLYSHYKHPKTAVLMGHARGVVLCAARSSGAEVLSYAATRVKRALTGNGHAGKTQMQSAILVRLGLSRLPEPADVADALAIALCAEQEHRSQEPASR